MEDRKFDAAVPINESVVQLAVQASLSVLISGGSASDREVVATGLHAQGPHSQQPFRSIVCGPASLTLPTEPGVVYLAEVDQLTPAHQTVLLDSLTRQQQSHILAGTGADLWAIVEAGGFSATLFYRLNTLHLILPSTPSADGVPTPERRTERDRWSEQHQLACERTAPSWVGRPGVGRKR